MCVCVRERERERAREGERERELGVRETESYHAYRVRPLCRVRPLHVSPKP